MRSFISNARKNALLVSGTIMTGLFTVLGGATVLLLVGDIGAMLRGKRTVSVVDAGEFLIFVMAVSLLNLINTYREFGRIQPSAYRRATRGMGVVAYIWSDRSAASHLHDFLVSLPCDGLPPAFLRRVRRTIALNRLCLTVVVVMAAVGIYIGVATRFARHN